MYHPYSYYHISFRLIFHIFFVSFYTLLIVLITVYYQRIAMLCFSYHIIYFILFFYIYFSFSFMFMPANTLGADKGKNCMYPKVRLLFSICMYSKVLSLYETVIFV